MLQLLWFLLLTNSSPASTFQSEVAEVHLAPDASKPDLIFLMKDGLVAKLPSHQSKLRPILTDGARNHQFFEFTLNDQREITSARALPKWRSPSPAALHLPHDFAPYQPTVLPNFEAAEEIFADLNPYFRRRSECYNRAHVWSYEQKQRRNLNSKKVFLFFTEKYIWEYNYKWWFHVSPFTLVQEGDRTTEYVLDYAFMEGPTQMHDWTNYFITPQTVCPTVSKYSAYEQHQWESYCYLIKVSMYFWQPYDVENLETEGTEKTQFFEDEVNHAYWQGF